MSPTATGLAPSTATLHDQPTVIAGYALAIGRALDHKGVDRHRVFRAAGLSESASNDPLDRMTSSQVAALYQACVEATGDPYFGLTVAKFMHVSNIHAVGYALFASKTLRDFCMRLGRFFAVVSQSAVLHVECDAQELALRFRHRTYLCGESEDAFLAFVLRFMRLLHRIDFTPLRVEFRHRCPPEGPGPYAAVFGVVPSFDGDETALVLAAAELDEPLTGSCPELAQFNDKIATNYLARLDKRDVVARTRASIIDLLSGGDCDRSKVARQICMSEATLQVRLAQRGTTFQDLLHETRHELALAYLAQRALSITEITFLLGFTDTSNFTRAFKRWTGTSPSSYRAGLLEPGKA